MAPNTLYQGVNSDLSRASSASPPTPTPSDQRCDGPNIRLGDCPSGPVGAPPPWSEQAGCPHHVWSSCSSSFWPVLGSIGKRKSPRLLLLFFFTRAFLPLGLWSR